LKAIDINPENRYQSALEMRRALERVRLSGNVSADENGNIIVIKNGNIYRYEIISHKGLLLFTAYKKNIKSYRETKYSKYCITTKSNAELKKITQQMCLELLA
jgi:hypothetical protein